MAEIKEKEIKEKSLGNTAKFSKKIILTFPKFSNRKDLLTVLLKDKKLYTVDEVENIIKKFMEGK